MKPDPIEVLNELLNVMQEQNEALRECNETFKNTIMLLNMDHKKLEMHVTSMHTKMLELKEQVKQL